MLTANLEGDILGMAAVGLRISGLLVFAPFFGSEAISARVKIGLTVALTILVAPVVKQAAVPVSVPGLVRLIAAEFVIGLLTGLSVQLVFEAAQFAGQLMGLQVGFSLVNVMDPNSQVETPVLSIFSQMLVMLVFFQMGAHRLLVRALTSSFAYLPLGGGHLRSEVARQLLHAAGGIWLCGVQVAAPLLITTILADMALGLLGKTSPQLPVLFLGLSVKSVLGLGVLALSLKYWPGIFEHYFGNAIHGMERWLGLAG